LQYLVGASSLLLKFALRLRGTEGEPFYGVFYEPPVKFLPVSLYDPLLAKIL